MGDETEIAALSKARRETYKEAQRLLMQLPPDVSVKLLGLTKELLDRPAEGTLTVDKASNGKLFMRGNGNEFGSATVDLRDAGA